MALAQAHSDGGTADRWRLPRPLLHPELIDGWLLDGAVKGMPAGSGAVRLADTAGLGLNVLQGNIPFPAAVIRRDALMANCAWMREFTRANGLEIAPHGKTTMSPQLFRLQLANGAWAITVATSQQLMVCKKFGVPRVIMANQPTGRAAIDACFATISGDDGFELIVLADSVTVVEALAAGAARASNRRPLGVLVEMGAKGGRTGARSASEGAAVVRAIAATPGLVLRGFECFEGVLENTKAVDRLLGDVLHVAELACAMDLIPRGAPIVLSAGGSAFFDRVGECFRTADLGGRSRTIIIRSGCYLTHDDIGYNVAHQRIIAETSLKLPEGGLTAAMEVWACVQSRPESNRAILTMGKRDVSHDAGLPVPLKWHRPGRAGGVRSVPQRHIVTALNDQHAYLDIPVDSPLQVGDMVGLGIGHPCTTFDKWQLIWIVDDDYTVVDAIRTFF